MKALANRVGGGTQVGADGVSQSQGAESSSCRKLRTMREGLSGSKGRILISHEFVLPGLVEWTQDLKKKKKRNYAFFKHFGKKKMYSGIL